MARGQRRIAPGAGAAVLICTAALGGCATSHIGSEWPCPASQGTPCTSVSAADPARTPADSGRRESDRGERCPEGCPPFAWLRRLGRSDTDVPTESDADGREAAAVPDTAGNEQDAHGAVSPSAGLRSEELIGRIWIAPYVDDSGVYHEASWVRAVVEPARWRLP